MGARAQGLEGQVLPVDPMAFESEPGGAQDIPPIAGHEQHFLLVHSHDLLDQCIAFGRRFEQPDRIDGNDVVEWTTAA